MRALVDVVVITLLALLPYLAAEMLAQKSRADFAEGFLVNCLNEKAMVVGGPQGEGVLCVRL